MFFARAPPVLPLLVQSLRVAPLLSPRTLSSTRHPRQQSRGCHRRSASSGTTLCASPTTDAQHPSEKGPPSDSQASLTFMVPLGFNFIILDLSSINVNTDGRGTGDDEGGLFTSSGICLLANYTRMRTNLKCSSVGGHLRSGVRSE